MRTARSQFLFLFPNCTGSSRYVTPQLLKGSGESTSIHSAIWKFFLVVARESKDGFARSEDWVRILKSKRELFVALKAEYICPPPDGDADPLAATQADAKWETYFVDQQLRQKIAKDTARAFQEIDYFQIPETLQTLEDILFLFCKTHPQYDYPQGLHELAALILYVFHNEMVAEETDTLGFIFNQSGVVADTFWTFSALAEAIEPLYQAGGDESYAVTMANQVQGRMVAEQNRELANALAQCGVAPQSYMLSWLRLLFLRVFDMEAVINMWDVLIAHLPALSVVANTCVAMLVSQKDKIIGQDDISVIQLLYHFPKTDSAVSYVRKGMSMHTKGRVVTSEDLQMTVAERLNCLARGLESVCQEAGHEKAIPYIMDLRRARDILLGVLSLDEMLPFEQAVELFSSTSVEMEEVPETQDEMVETAPAIEMPKAATGKKVDADVLFGEVSAPRKPRKKVAMKSRNPASLFD